MNDRYQELSKQYNVSTVWLAQFAYATFDEIAVAYAEIERAIPRYKSEQFKRSAVSKRTFLGDLITGELVI